MPDSSAVLSLVLGAQIVESAVWWRDVGGSLLAESIKAAATAIVAVAASVLTLRRTLRIEAQKIKTNALIAKRVEVYDRIAPLANDFYCYSTRVGEFKSMTPAGLLDKKRSMDRAWHPYAEIFSKPSQYAYDAFMETYFRTRTGVGQSAKLRANRDKLAEQWGRKWKRRWDISFSQEERPQTSEDFKGAYERLLRALAGDLGVGIDER